MRTNKSKIVLDSNESINTIFERIYWLSIENIFEYNSFKDEEFNKKIKDLIIDITWKLAEIKLEFITNQYNKNL